MVYRIKRQISGGNKFHAVKTTVDGITFDSQKEARRYAELKILQSTGVIKDLQRQIEFELIPKQPGERKAVYTADFVYEMNGQTVVEDVKGAATKHDQAYVLRRKLMLWRHGIKIVEV